MNNRSLAWKLIFKCLSVPPHQKVKIYVESKYNFWGSLMNISTLDNFEIENIYVGNYAQLNGPAKARRINDVRIPFDIGIQGMSHALSVYNPTDNHRPFRAELHGIILVKTDTIIESEEWEGPL